MRFNPIEFFYELLNGNPYLIGVLIFTVCISLIPNSLCETILELPQKIKKMFAKKPVDAPIQQVNQNYDFVPSDDNYFTFKGRIGRKVFIKRTAFAYLGIILVALFFAWLTDSTSKIEKNPLYIALILAFMVPFTLFLYANMNRRFHDIGKSSNWTLAMFLASNTVAPIYFLALLYLFCKKGNPDANEYGPNPLQQ
ncbi:DUF805 domain-containing protein [Phascolarctobacterium succinatutens]|jgi:uncharacterized membrane protein YhaH (DUF805 family)|uniref:DUF805 domain-containing protein n=1 Tax=Phascolarctobacterium succinatutens TaxID=626940 RepID=UPI002666F952|nr:DUF805 domain-containing protein [Phascolarctobacterium succinatutens]